MTNNLNTIVNRIIKYLESVVILIGLPLVCYLFFYPIYLGKTNEKKCVQIAIERYDFKNYINCFPEPWILGTLIAEKIECSCYDTEYYDDGELKHIEHKIFLLPRDN